jgi:hypothetical protein
MRIGSIFSSSFLTALTGTLLLPVLASETMTLRGKKKIGGGLQRGGAGRRGNEVGRGDGDVDAAARELGFSNSSSSGEQKIVGGTMSPARPWFAQGYGCGATLIWQDFLVTAAHCYNDDWQYDAFSPGDRVYIGHTRYRDQTQGSETRVVRRVFRHPNFNLQNGFQNDIMLVQLTQRVSSTRPVARMNTNPNVPAEGTSVTAMGFGTLHQGGSSSTILRRVTVPVVGTSRCQNMYRGEFNIYPGTMVRVWECVDGFSSSAHFVTNFRSSPFDQMSRSVPEPLGRTLAKVR